MYTYSCFGTSPLYKTLSHIKKIEVQKERDRGREGGRERESVCGDELNIVDRLHGLIDSLVHQ